MLLRSLLPVLSYIATLEAAAPPVHIDPAALAAPLPYSPPSLGDTVTAYLLDGGALNELGEFLEQNDGFPNLHLEEYTFQEESELGFGAFKSLFKHGYYKYFSKEILLKGLCGQGKLEHLKFLLSSLSDKLIVPSFDDFKSAAAKGHWNILEWGLQEGLIKSAAAKGCWTIGEWRLQEGLMAEANQRRSIAIALAVNGHAGHFKEWLVVTGVKFDNDMIEEVLKIGPTKAVEDVLSVMGDPKELLLSLGGNRLDVLAKSYLPALETLLEVFPSRKFKGLESVSERKIKEICSSEIPRKEGLAHHWPGNLKFLKQVVDMKGLEDSERIKILRKNACTKEAMEWLKEHMTLCPDNMNWPYLAGDREAIDWAKENCPSTPHTKENFEEAVQQGHVKIVEKVDVDQLRENEGWLFKHALYCGRLQTFDCLRERITPIRKGFAILWNVSTDQHLPLLERALNNGFDINWDAEIHHAVENGDLKTVKWLFEKFSDFRFFNLALKQSILSDHHEIYMFFRQNFPKKITRSLVKDFKKAFCSGSLNIVKVIADMDRSAISGLTCPDVPKSRYSHVVEWLEANVFNKAPQSPSDAFSEMKIN